MENILEELWYGNINPQENRQINSKEMKELLRYGMKAEAKCENERFELYSKRASKAALLALRAVLRCRATLVGATFAASLESELSDSALLGYLRRRPLCGLRRKSSESLAAK